MLAYRLPALAQHWPAGPLKAPALGLQEQSTTSTNLKCLVLVEDQARQVLDEVALALPVPQALSRVSAHWQAGPGGGPGLSHGGPGHHHDDGHGRIFQRTPQIGKLSAGYGSRSAALASPSHWQLATGLGISVFIKLKLSREKPEHHRHGGGTARHRKSRFSVISARH